MFLSRMKLDTANRQTMRALAMPNLFHGAVETAFPGERKRRLWRIDNLHGNLYLLLLSEEKPDLAGVVSQFGFPDDVQGWESRSYSPLLQRITEGSRWQFRLTANPTVSKSRGSSVARGTVYAHETAAHQMQWLAERAEKHGFYPDAVVVTGSRWYRFSKGGSRRPVTLLSVTYDGVLTVTNAEQFRQVLVNGLGRGKAYGMGLLTVMRLPEGLR